MALLKREQYLCEPPLAQKRTLLRQEFVELLALQLHAGSAAGLNET